MRLLTILENLVRDTRLAWRSLWRTPGFTVVAVLVLGVGIGVVSGAFSLINIMAFKPIAIDEPERVLGVYALHAETRNGRAFSYAEYEELSGQTETFASVAAYDIIDGGVEEGDVTRRAMLAVVSANYFETLGVPIAQGRDFTLAEERGEEPPVVVVSHDYWVRNGADPRLLGSAVRVNGEPLVVVGIAPPRFIGTMSILAVDVWAPLAAMERIALAQGGRAPSLRDPATRSLYVFGRLADGIAVAAADSELAALGERVGANSPDPNGVRYTYVAGAMGRLSMSTAPNPENDEFSDFVVPFAMTAVVLLIACLNLANMFLARGARRRTEMAIRQSLGSGRARLIRQLLTEGLLLAALGGAVGLFWTHWGTSLIATSLAKVVPGGMAIVVDLRPDARVLLVTATTCVVATLLFGFGPAWRVTGMDVASGLKEGAGAVRFGRRRSRQIPSGRSVMIVAQIALSFVMLTAGGLFMRSALHAANATPGFSLDSTLLVELDPSVVGYDETRTRTVYAQVLERLRAVPRVEGAGMTSLVPLSGITNSEWVQPAGLPPDEGRAYALRTVISDGYFEALRLPILRGRNFTSLEITSADGPRVAIVDERLAERLFPDADALGRHVQPASRDPARQPTVMEIVGIAPGTPGPDYDPAPAPHLYLPFGQNYSAAMHVIVGVDAGVPNPSALLETIRNEIRGIDASLPVLSLLTMRDLRDRNWNLWLARMGGRLFTLLGGLAVFLATVGLYGAKAFLMASRTHEIGVRMALGASRGDVLKQMMRESAAVIVVGLGMGLLLALAAAQVLRGFLYEISATDPWVLLGASVSLALAATVATWLPARHASRIEPTAALRNE
jgi:predicted permease